MTCSFVCLVFISLISVISFIISFYTLWVYYAPPNLSSGWFAYEFSAFLLEIKDLLGEEAYYHHLSPAETQYSEYSLEVKAQWLKREVAECYQNWKAALTQPSSWLYYSDQPIIPSD